jgi:hypothetical protein
MSTRTSDATKTTTAVHTALVRVRNPSRSDEVRGEASVVASEEDPTVLRVSRSCCEPMAPLTLPAGVDPQPVTLIDNAHHGRSTTF